MEDHTLKYSKEEMLAGKNNIKNLVVDFLEDETTLIGASYEEVQKYFGYEPDSYTDEEWIYLVEKKIFGLYKKNFYLYFENGVVKDYYLDI